MRCFALVLVATLTAAASASLLPAFVRQEDAPEGVTPEDAIGNFKIRVFLGLDCPRAISHSETVNEDGVIPHSAIEQNKNSCSDGEMTVYTDAADAIAAVSNQESKDLIGDFESSGEPAIYGIEKNGRRCGGSVLGKETVVILFTPAETLVLGPRDVYPGGKRYMVVDDPNVPGLCEYSTGLRSETDGAGAGAGTGAGTGGTDKEPLAPSPTEPVDPTDDPAGGSGGGVIGGGGNNRPNKTKKPKETPDATDDGTGTGGAGGVGTGGPGEGAETTPDPSVLPEETTDADGQDGEDDDDDSVCFPADAEVETEDGDVKKISDVQIGDRVKVADGVYSDVYMFTHKDANTVHDFVSLSTSSGETISATRGHYLYINGRFAAAASAKAGDILELGNSARTTIERVSIEKKVGLFNPQTVHGDIIVNSIRASTFTRTVEPQTAQALLAPFRMMYDFMGVSSSILNNGADNVAALLPKGQVSL